MKDKDLYIGNRENTLKKSWVTDLWMSVIRKAINDLALYSKVIQDGGKLSEEEITNAETAYGFLFDPEYTIQIGNMELTTEELLSHWPEEFYNIDRWRKDKKEEIKKLIEVKRKKRSK